MNKDAIPKETIDQFTEFLQSAEQTTPFNITAKRGFWY
jgi:hypothetical protein